MPLDLLSESRSDNPWRQSVKIFERMDESDVGQLIAILNRKKDLEELYLNETNINDEMATRIANALRNSKALRKLSFRDNLIGDQGAINIVKAIKGNKALQELDFSGNDITDWGLIQLFKYLAYTDDLRKLDLSNNSFRPMKNAKKFENCDKGPMINFLRRNKSLEKLNFAHTHIFDNTAMITLKENKKMNLKFLGLSTCVISKDTEKTLTEFLKEKRSLESLDLRHAFFSADDSMVLILNALAENKTLKALKIDWGFMTKENMDVLPKFLKGNLMLESLSISYSRLSKPSIFIDNWESLIGNKILKVLNFDHCRFGDRGASALSKLLKTNPGLEELYLSYNKIGEMGLKDLIESLEDNTHLKTLNLRGNSFSVNSFEVLAKSLNTNTTLKVLNLSSTEIHSKHIKQLDKALEKSSLEELDFSSNELGDDGAIILAECLEKNLHIKKLYLNECKIGDKGAVALAQLLEKNPNLEELHLEGNGIGQEGLAALSKSLKEINSVQDKKGAFQVLKLTRSDASKNLVNELNSPQIVLAENSTVFNKKSSRVSSYDFTRSLFQQEKEFFKGVSSIEEGDRLIRESNRSEKDQKKLLYNFIKQGFKRDLFKEEQQLIGLDKLIKRFDVAQQKALINNLCGVLVRRNMITALMSTTVTNLLEQLPNNERQFYLHHKDNVVLLERLIGEGQPQQALNLIKLSVKTDYIIDTLFCKKRVEQSDPLIKSFSEETCRLMEQMMSNKAIRSELKIDFNTAKELVTSSTKIGLVKPIEEENEYKLSKSSNLNLT